MRVQVVVVLVAASCGVPVDIGMLEDTTSGGSGGPATEDATLTDSMTGPVQMTSMPEESSSSDTIDEPPPPVRHYFAILEGPAIDTGGEGGESDTGGGSGMSTSVGTSASSTTGDSDTSGIEVGTMTIYATTGFASCKDPFGLEPCPATWTYSFQLPPDLQFVGASGPIGTENGGFFSEVGDEPVDCSFGGGTLSGNFEITAIDDTHVAGRMFDLEPTMWETEVVFDAPICSN